MVFDLFICINRVFLIIKFIGNLINRFIIKLFKGVDIEEKKCRRERLSLVGNVDLLVFRKDKVKGY